MFGKKFAFGVNYFSVKTRENMWKDFSAETVERDFIALRKLGIKWVRLFPLWKEFQPLGVNSGFTESPEDSFPEQLAGVSEIMMSRLDIALNLCKKHGLRVVLTIFAGFEDGTDCIPDIFADKNIFTNPLALMWEQRYIKYLVTRFKDHPAFCGWSIGNIYRAASSIKGDTAAQYSWTALVCNAIKAIDKEHPVISGQSVFGTESLTVQKTQGWQIIPHAQCVDILTSQFSTCNNMYEDIGGKLSFVEEASCTDADADFIRGNLLSSYLHDCYGYFWKYAFVGAGNSGLFTNERTETLLGKEAKRIMTVISQTELPKYERHAVCIIPYNLRKASSFAGNIMRLTEQNDIGVKYCFANQEFYDSKLYIVPALDSERYIGKNCAERLLDKARKGASVYISVSGSDCTVFQDMGIDFVSRRAHPVSATVNIEGTQLSVNSDYYYNSADRADKILANFSDGTPAIVSHSFGMGKIIISFFSVEIKSALDSPDKTPYYKVYSLILKNSGVKPVFYTENPFVVAKEHKIDNKRSIVSLMNYSDKLQQYTVGATIGYQVKKVLYGELDGKLSENDAVIFEIEKY